MQIVTKLPNENIQNYWLAMFWGGGVNYQMQIVTKLPNENIQNYQLEMFDSGGGGGCKLPNANCDQTTKWKYPKLPTRNVWFWGRGEVNYQTQIVTKLPNENIQNYQLEMFWGRGW